MPSNLYLHSRAPEPPLRIGVLMDDMRMMRIFADVLDDILRCDFANIELLVIHTPAVPPAPLPESKPARYLHILRSKPKRNAILYDQYLKIDRRVTAGLEDPLELVDCTERLAGIERMEVAPLVKGFVHRFPEDALERLRAHDLDVLLRFGFNILRGPVLTAAKYGIWSFHHGDNDCYRGGPALFWEIYEGCPTSGVILQVLTEELDAGLVLSKALFRTEPGLSLRKNRHSPYWGSTDMVIHKLRELHECGWEYVESRAVPRQPYVGKKKIYRTPKNGEMFRWLIPALARRTVRRITGARDARSEWRVGIRENGSLPDASKAPDLGGFRWIPSPEGRYLADPFIVPHKSKLWLFVEDYRVASSKGVLSVCELRPDGAPAGDLQVCLEKRWHLSYPHVFEHDGAMFMVPESNRGNRLELYRAVDFPTLWELEKVLFEGNTVDTTLWFQDGTWFFFTTLVEPRGRGLTLLIFCSASLTGEWTLHPASPISRDVRNARAAGAIFRHGGKLLRPTQDNSVRYGYSFTFNEITKLNPREYEERPLTTVLPSLPDMTGVHTYSRCGNIEAIDGNFLIRG